MNMTTQTDLSPFELERYSRQIRIEGFGVESQHRLKDASVTISRVGGVGGTVAVNLAYAGVGKLIIAHDGKVVPEYLNRWHLAVPSDVGRPCTEVFIERLKTINPEIEVVALPENINENNVTELVSQADVVVDGAPLFEERYLMNQEAVRQNKPIVSGAVNSTESYITTIFPHETACLACIYPKKPDYWTNIKVFPVIGPGSFIIGSMMAMDVIKIVTGFGSPLKNTLWFFDLETGSVRHLRTNKRLDCSVCGK